MRANLFETSNPSSVRRRRQRSFSNALFNSPSRRFDEFGAPTEINPDLVWFIMSFLFSWFSWWLPVIWHPKASFRVSRRRRFGGRSGGG
jgi:hypothetical protein